MGGLYATRGFPAIDPNLGEEAVLAAVSFKIRFSISYADAFAAAAAQDQQAALMTGDPELLRLDHAITLVPLSRSG